MSGAAAMSFGTLQGSPGTINTIPNAAAASPTPAGLTLVNDGSWSISGASAGNWVNPASSTIAAQWSVKATLTGGSIDSGTTGSWLSLGTSRAWQKNGVGTATLTLEFRDALGTIRKTQTGVTIQVA